MKCFYCNLEIEDKSKYKLVALEKPYVNLYFHPEHEILKNFDELLLYLKNNLEKVYNYIENSGKNRRK